MATQKEIAVHLDITPRWVRDLIKQGVLPAGGPGETLSPDACRVAYIRYLRGAAAGRVKGMVADAEVGGAPDYTALLEAEKYREKKRQNDVQEGLVAPVALLTDALQRAGAIIVASLESLPLLMKRHWPEITGDQVTMVKKAIAECRNVIADMKIDLNE